MLCRRIVNVFKNVGVLVKFLFWEQKKNVWDINTNKKEEKMHMIVVIKKSALIKHKFIDFPEIEMI